ncbi:MAG: transcription-repair coupling factor, partial [Treponema sp.]|nr:transcription-repair coupling factor [Treponema sp.]
MNILSFTDLLDKIGRAPAITECVAAFGRGGQPLEVEGCDGSLAAFLLSALYRAEPGPYLAVVAQETDAADLEGDLAAAGVPFRHFPWWGAIPYRELSGSSPVFAQRARVLSEIAAGFSGIVIVTERAFLSPLPPPEYLAGLGLRIESGRELDLRELATKLAAYGYLRVPRVQMRGEFALRGEILDIFVEDRGESPEAFRLLCDFDRLQSVRRLDPLLQGGGPSREELAFLDLFPLHEVLWSDDRIESLQANLAGLPEFSDTFRSQIVGDLIERRQIEGEELFYPLAFETPARFSDYLGDSGTLVLFGRERLENALDSLHREWHGCYARSRREGAEAGRPKEYPLPERLILDLESLVRDSAATGRLLSFMVMTRDASPGSLRIRVPCDPPRSFFGNIAYLKEEFSALLDSGWHIAVAAESPLQAERIGMLLPPHDRLFLLDRPVSGGFALPELRLALVQENEIFGRRRRPPRSLKTARSSPIDTFVELNPGDYVVHINHGIGLFKGIQRINALGYERDYISLGYAGDETVFVPVEQVDLVQRYIGNEGSPPRLDTVGSKSWENRKTKVRQSVLELAEKLIDLYSKRKSSTGFAFPADSEWQTMFEAAFPFEETDDQLRCIREIKTDMESPVPMDRLVCGDVGYGKTEVALRACFKAIMGGRQVAFLVPTTILAEQHYGNF